jgi:hypothetical protein
MLIYAYVSAPERQRPPRRVASSYRIPTFGYNAELDVALSGTSRRNFTTVPELWSGRRWERYMVRESASNSMFAD